jgi:hypothetical protein
MKDLLEVKVYPEGGRPRLHYQVRQSAWPRLQRTLLSKNLLFTDQEAWKSCGRIGVSTLLRRPSKE